MSELEVLKASMDELYLKIFTQLLDTAVNPAELNNNLLIYELMLKQYTSVRSDFHLAYVQAHMRTMTEHAIRQSEALADMALKLARMPRG